VAPNEVRRRVRGALRFNELCENVLQHVYRLLQDIIVPVARDLKAFGDQNGFTCLISFRRCVLTTIDLDDEALFRSKQNREYSFETAPVGEI
jgi:hypothetical protein